MDGLLSREPPYLLCADYEHVNSLLRDTEQQLSPHVSQLILANCSKASVLGCNSSWVRCALWFMPDFSLDLIRKQKTADIRCSEITAQHKFLFTQCLPGE